MQNFASAGAAVPQAGQRRSSGEPQDMQKRACTGFSVPQFPQDCVAIVIQDTPSRPAAKMHAVSEEPLARRLAVEGGHLLRWRPAVVVVGLFARLARLRAYALWPDISQPLLIMDVGSPRACAWLSATFRFGEGTRRRPSPATWNALRGRGLLVGGPSRLVIEAAERALGRQPKRPRLSLYSPSGAADSKGTCFVFEPGRREPTVVVKAMSDPRFAARLRREIESVEALRAKLAGIADVVDALPLPPLYAGEVGGDYVVAQGLDPLAQATGREDRPAALAWLRAFQRATTKDEMAWGPDDDERELAFVRDAWRRVRPQMEEIVVDRMSRLLQQMHGIAVRRCAVHGDFWRGNIAGGGGRLRVYDWEWFEPEGRPFLDLWLYELGQLRQAARRREVDLAAATADALSRVQRELRARDEDARFALATAASSIGLITFRERHATGMPGGGEEASIRVMTAVEQLLLDDEAG
jgi:hypothetical protein